MGKSEEQKLSSQESLEIIHTMIAQAKGDFEANAFHFLLWGWIAIIGSLGHYTLLTFTSVAYPQLAWLIIIIGIAGSIAKGVKSNRKARVKTYTGKIYGIIWITFLVNYFILLFFLDQINYYITPLILLMAAASTFISGSLMRYRPLQAGAGCIWIAGIAAFMVSLPNQLLVTAVAILLGYLVPGYLLKNSNKSK